MRSVEISRFHYVWAFLTVWASNWVIFISSEQFWKTQVGIVSSMFPPHMKHNRKWSTSVTFSLLEMLSVVGRGCCLYRAWGSLVRSEWALSVLLPVLFSHWSKWVQSDSLCRVIVFLHHLWKWCPQVQRCSGCVANVLCIKDRCSHESWRLGLFWCFDVWCDTEGPVTTLF